MAPLDRPGSVDSLRLAIRAAAGRTSLSDVARRVGVSPPALRNLLAGAEPRAGTLRKLRRWYLVHASEDRQDDADVAAVAAAWLLEHLPEGMQPDALAELVALVERRSREAGVPVPRWVERLRSGGE